eukprot:IDg1058t1
MLVVKIKVLFAAHVRTIRVAGHGSRTRVDVRDGASTRLKFKLWYDTTIVQLRGQRRWVQPLGEVMKFGPRVCALRIIHERPVLLLDRDRIQTRPKRRGRSVLLSRLAQILPPSGTASLNWKFHQCEKRRGLHHSDNAPPRTERM